MKNVVEFPDGLVLIGAGYVEINGNKQSLTKPISTTVTANVPKKTKFVHVAVTAVDMSFGTTGNIQPGDMASIWFETSNRKVNNGTFTCDFKAVLQNKPNANATGVWTGIFYLELTCFGDIPKA